jgi:hypothetical protein
MEEVLPEPARHFVDDLDVMLAERIAPGSPT